MQISIFQFLPILYNVFFPDQMHLITYVCALRFLSHNKYLRYYKRALFHPIFIPTASYARDALRTYHVKLSGPRSAAAAASAIRCFAPNISLP